MRMLWRDVVVSWAFCSLYVYLPCWARIQMMLKDGDLEGQKAFPNEYCKIEGQFLPHPHSPCHYLRCSKADGRNNSPEDLKGFLYSRELKCPEGYAVDDDIFTISNNHVMPTPCSVKDIRCLAEEEPEQLMATRPRSRAPIDTPTYIPPTGQPRQRVHYREGDYDSFPNTHGTEYHHHPIQYQRQSSIPRPTEETDVARDADTDPRRYGASNPSVRSKDPRAPYETSDSHKGTFLNTEQNGREVDVTLEGRQGRLPASHVRLDKRRHGARHIQRVESLAGHSFPRKKNIVQSNHYDKPVTVYPRKHLSSITESHVTRAHTFPKSQYAMQREKLHAPSETSFIKMVNKKGEHIIIPKGEQGVRQNTINNKEIAYDEPSTKHHNGLITKQTFTRPNGWVLPGDNNIRQNSHHGHQRLDYENDNNNPPNIYHVRPGNFNRNQYNRNQQTAGSYPTDSKVVPGMTASRREYERPVLTEKPYTKSIPQQGPQDYSTEPESLGIYTPPIKQEQVDSQAEYQRNLDNHAPLELHDKFVTDNFPSTSIFKDSRHITDNKPHDYNNNDHRNHFHDQDQSSKRTVPYHARGSSIPHTSKLPVSNDHTVPPQQMNNRNWRNNEFVDEKDSMGKSLPATGASDGRFYSRLSNKEIYPSPYRDSVEEKTIGHIRQIDNVPYPHTAKSRHPGSDEGHESGVSERENTGDGRPRAFERFKMKYVPPNERYNSPTYDDGGSRIDHGHEDTVDNNMSPRTHLAIEEVRNPEYFLPTMAPGEMHQSRSTPNDNMEQRNKNRGQYTQNPVAIHPGGLGIGPGEIGSQRDTSGPEYDTQSARSFQTRMPGPGKHFQEQALNENIPTNSEGSPVVQHPIHSQIPGSRKETLMKFNSNSQRQPLSKQHDVSASARHPGHVSGHHHHRRVPLFLTVNTHQYIDTDVDDGDDLPVMMESNQATQRPSYNRVHSREHDSPPIKLNYDSDIEPQGESPHVPSLLGTSPEEVFKGVRESAILPSQEFLHQERHRSRRLGPQLPRDKSSPEEVFKEVRESAILPSQEFLHQERHRRRRLDPQLPRDKSYVHLDDTSQHAYEHKEGWEDKPTVDIHESDQDELVRADENEGESDGINGQQGYETKIDN